MVSLRLLLVNFLKMRRSPRCSVMIGRHSPSIPYIITAERGDRVVIGNFCSIGYGTIIITHKGHLAPAGLENYRVSTFPMARLTSTLFKSGFKSSYWLRDPKNFVSIGHDCWIGANAVILPGIRIGNGAIVGAGSVVTHDVPPYAVVAGVPARLLRYRYSREQIEKLKKIAWWNWSDEKITENVDYFYGKVEDFIEKFYAEVENQQTPAQHTSS
jgi:virginiamycin A acetyltransferase